jgi:sigma-B regulation protein RsbU (phosphoserine phosphatase)
MLRFSIKYKILLIMLILSGIAFGAISWLTFRNMKNLGLYTLDSCNELGKSALRDSRSALIKHSREELLSLVTEQATISNVQLKRISEELSVLANLASRYLVGEKGTLSNLDCKKFISYTQPVDNRQFSCASAFNRHSNTEKTKRLEELSILHPIFKFIYGNHENVEQVYLCTSDGYFLGYPWYRFPKGYNPKLREWYLKASKTKDAVWVGPYISSADNRLVLTCSQAIRDSKNKLMGICAIDLTVKNISRNFIGNQLDPSAMAFLLDQKGYIVAHRGMTSGGLTWSQDFKKENLLRSDNAVLRKAAKGMIAGMHGVEKIKFPNTPEFYMAYAPIPATKWSVGVLVASKFMTESAHKTELLIRSNMQTYDNYILNFLNKSFSNYLMVGAVVIASILLIGIMLSQKITDPILKLKKKAAKIGQGNFESTVHISTGDELEKLDCTFDKMVADLQEYMENIAETVQEREKIERELAVAANIQNSMLPAQCDLPEQVNISAFIKPAKEVGGDFYNYFMIDDRYLFFCIGDVSGKGVPAALFMARTTTLTAHEGRKKVSPEKLLFNLNNALSQNNDACMFATLFIGMLDTNTGEISFANAGHNLPLLKRGSDAEFVAVNSGIAIGPYPVSSSVFKLEKLKLQPGDALIVYSDGITEALNTDGMMFGNERFKECCAQTDDNSKLVKKIITEVNEFCGEEPQADDITLLMLEFAIPETKTA